MPSGTGGPGSALGRPGSPGGVPCPREPGEALDRRCSGGSLSLRLVLVLATVWAFSPNRLHAQFTLFHKDRASLELGGYLFTLTGLHDQGFQLPEMDQRSGFNAEVLRLKWNLRFGDKALVEVHDRFQIDVSSASSGLGGPAAGFGVSKVPGRSVDLSHFFIREDRLRVWHDVDRLSLTVYTGLGDATLGRQAITWGISNLFPVADLWVQFSPFELDTEEKPGVDAIRVLSYPGKGLELDAIVADRGQSKYLSAGMRASLSVSWADLYLAGGKFWNEAMVLGGVAAPMGNWKLRAEGVLPYDLDEDSGDLPRATLGLDRLGGEFMLSGEYHYNGIGAATVEEYGEVLQDPRFARGESYYLGRHYLGAVGNWTPGNDRLALTLSGMWNLIDGSTAVSPAVTYDFGQETRVSLGGLLSNGNKPELDSVPVPKSEYGMYGDLFYVRMSVYF